MLLHGQWSCPPSLCYIFLVSFSTRRHSWGAPTPLPSYDGGRSIPAVSSCTSYLSHFMLTCEIPVTHNTDAGPVSNGADGPGMSCADDVCSLVQAQWKVMESMISSKTARAVGVSNYCQRCFVRLVTFPFFLFKIVPSPPFFSFFFWFPRLCKSSVS